jgi:hypothetical protein
MPEEIKEQKFGIGQMGKETPKWAKMMFKIFFYITSIAGLAVTSFTNIPPNAKATVLEIVVFANTAMHMFSQMFGLDDSESFPGSRRYQSSNSKNNV